MTILHEAIRESLRAQSLALRVPERPPLDREAVDLQRSRGQRWLVAAACLSLVVAGAIAVAVRRADPVDPAGPVDSAIPDSTAPAAPVVPETTMPAPSVPSERGGDLLRPFLGTWVTTGVLLGSTATLIVEASDDDRVEVTATDFAPMCSGSSTMSGTGRLASDTELVLPAPVLTCDDGSEPQSLTGGDLEEELRNLTFTRDPATDILTDDIGSVWTRPAPDPSAAPAAPATDAAVVELLDGFLAARLAGDGAQRYLNVPEEEIPLLYSTTSGARYDRAEFEPVTGVAWPYGFRGFLLRLFAGDVVVEQLVFTPAEGRLGLEFDPNGFGTEIAATTEDGRALAVPVDLAGGEVTLEIAHPWILSGDGTYGRLIPEGRVDPTTDGGERIDWDELSVIADPDIAVGCETGPRPAGAEALAESIRSDPDLGATAPAVVRIGGNDAVMMDLTIAAGTTICSPASAGGDLLRTGVLNLVVNHFETMFFDDGLVTGSATGERMRLYLVDVPDGAAVQILAVAIVAPESTFERAVQAAAPIVESVEFLVP